MTRTLYDRAWLPRRRPLRRLFSFWSSRDVSPFCQLLSGPPIFLCAFSSKLLCILNCFARRISSCCDCSEWGLPAGGLPFDCRCCYDLYGRRAVHRRFRWFPVAWIWGWTFFHSGAGLVVRRKRGCFLLALLHIRICSGVRNHRGPRWRTLAGPCGCAWKLSRSAPGDTKAKAKRPGVWANRKCGSSF